jgi:rRNA maturation protein Rpf1
MEGVAEKALEYDANRVLIIDRRHGGPGRIGFYQVSASGLVSVFPILHVAGIRLQREFGHVKLRSTRFEAIVVSSEGEEEIIKVANSLSSFFNVPAFLVNKKPYNYPLEMHISYNATRRIQITFIDTFRNVEVGPRITLSQVVWETNK